MGQQVRRKYLLKWRLKGVGWDIVGVPSMGGVGRRELLRRRASKDLALVVTAAVYITTQ